MRCREREGSKGKQSFHSNEHRAAQLPGISVTIFEKLRFSHMHLAATAHQHGIVFRRKERCPRDEARKTSIDQREEALRNEQSLERRERGRVQKAPFCCDDNNVVPSDVSVLVAAVKANDSGNSRPNEPTTVSLSSLLSINVA